MELWATPYLEFALLKFASQHVHEFLRQVKLCLPGVSRVYERAPIRNTLKEAKHGHPVAYNGNRFDDYASLTSSTGGDALNDMAIIDPTGTKVSWALYLAQVFKWHSVRHQWRQ